MSRIEDKTVKYKGITKRYYRFLYLILSKGRMAGSSDFNYNYN